MSKKKLLFGLMNQMGNHNNHHNNHHNHGYHQQPVNHNYQQPNHGHQQQGFHQSNPGFQQPVNNVNNETIANYERQINALKQQLADQEMELIRKDSQIKALREQLGFE